MSPPPAGPKPASSARARHSRNNSGTASPLPSSSSKASSKRQPDAVQPASQSERKVHYTLIVRLPYPRGDFEDPPQVDWNADKDRKLWRIIATTPKIGDLDWEEIAREFGVELNFILQQAAWLYQRHMDNVREQMKKVGASTAGSSGAPTPVPGQHPSSSAAGGVPMKRLGSGGSSRGPSSLSVRTRESPVPAAKTEITVPGTPRTTAAPPLSRTPSTKTVTQSRLVPTSPRQPIQRSFRTANPSAPARLATAVGSKAPSLRSPTGETIRSSPAASDSSSSSSSDSDEGPIRRSHIFARRPQPRFQSRRKSGLGHALGAAADDDSAADSEDEDSPTFAAASSSKNARPSDTTARDPDPSRRDRASTLTRPSATEHKPTSPPPSDARLEDEISSTSSPPTSPQKPSVPPDPPTSKKGKSKAPPPPPLTSSASSAASSAAAAQRPLTSPPHRAALARLHNLSPSPSRRTRPGKAPSDAAAAAAQQPTSDGTPSMGSSFSDLDDTSITQSALEEALASNLRHGGASRLSSFGALGLGGAWRAGGQGQGQGGGAGRYA